MRNQPPVEVWLAKLSTGACLRRPKAIVVDTEGTQTICDKHGHGSCDLTSCLEVDQLLERTTSLIPGILQELGDGVADPGLGGYIEVRYGYVPAMVAVPEEHALPDGRYMRGFGRWEAQRPKSGGAGRELAEPSRGSRCCWSVRSASDTCRLGSRVRAATC